MKNISKHIQAICYLLIILISAAFFGCDTEDWLDVKSRKSDVRPETLEDLQALLDYDTRMNANYPAMGQVGSDNSYVTHTVWQSAYYESERNAYIWAQKIYVDNGDTDWQNPYENVAYSNIVLESLREIPQTSANKTKWENIRGSALFYRAYAFYHLVNLFAKPYDPATAATDLGIVLRRTADVNVPSQRATVEESYLQILEDLDEAEGLLPETPMHQTRPCKAAARMVKARLYLNMGEYQRALQETGKALEDYSALLDFNTIDTTSSNPFSPYPDHEEVIFYSTVLLKTTNFYFYAMVDTTLYNSYQPNDLRRSVFYKDLGTSIQFKGRYSGSAYNFGGLATNELYLIRAECQARLGEIAAAMETLNTLLRNRWRQGTFVPSTASDQEEALELIINERRKELPFTGNLRWEDLRRLNKEPRFATTLTRVLDGTTYTLPPNDPRYVLDIPPREVEESGIPQNIR